MRKKHVSATDLATLAKCERLAVLDARYGRRASRHTQAARARGDQEHRRHHREAMQYATIPATDKRCFIASVVYGPEAWQTQRLRSWRDQRLLPRGWGRLIVRLYYRLSPPLASYLGRHRWLRRIARVILDGLVRIMAGGHG